MTPIRLIRLSGWFVAIGLVALSGKPVAGEETGFVSIFNGTDLSDWEGRPGAWEVRDGAIWCAGLKEGGKNWLIWRGGEPENFELRLTFRYEAGNSGVQVRSEEQPDFQVSGYQVEVAQQDKMGLWHHSLSPEDYRKFLATAGQKVVLKSADDKEIENLAEPSAVQAAFKEGEWNEMTVIADGERLIQKVNGVVLSDLTDKDAKYARRKGVIAFQDHGKGTVAAFKDIRIKIVE